MKSLISIVEMAGGPFDRLQINKVVTFTVPVLILISSSM